MPPPARLSPAALERCLPFAAFMGLLAVRGYWPASWGGDARWLYAAQALVPAGLLAYFWRGYGELARQNWPSARDVLLAVGVGALVFALWIRLDAPWMQVDTATAHFVPLDASGQPLWPLIACRLFGAALVVPVMEELFWRSFLMRWVQHPGFERVDPRFVGWRAIVIATFVFTLAHTLWLAAALAGLAYAWLYRRQGQLWSAVIAHAVTNGMLGVWVIATGRWEFW